MIKKYATIIIAFILIGSGGFAQETVDLQVVMQKVKEALLVTL